MIALYPDHIRPINELDTEIIRMHVIMSFSDQTMRLILTNGKDYRTCRCPYYECTLIESRMTSINTDVLTNDPVDIIIKLGELSEYTLTHIALSSVRGDLSLFDVCWTSPNNELAVLVCNPGLAVAISLAANIPIVAVPSEFRKLPQISPQP